MPVTPCARCNAARALIIRPKNHEKLCKTCFTQIFEDEVHETIVANGLFRRGERIAIGASGGKDSTVLASVLKTLNEKHDYGLDLVLLSIDEGIKGYRDDSLETVKRNAGQYDMPLEIVGYDELYGWTMDQVVAQIGKKGNCTYCGVFRRQALDRGAARLGVGHVVTGHNADDVAETVMMNLLRGDLPRLARATSIITGSAESSVRRSKPLKYAYEKEIVLYAHHKKLDYFSTECIYSPEAFRGSARALIKDLEKIRPSAILDVVKSGEDMARLVPGQISGNAAKRDRDGVTEEEDEHAMEGGCGSTNGRSSGGEMADMEKRLVEDETAVGKEVDVTSQTLNGQRHDRYPTKGANKTPDGCRDSDTISLNSTASNTRNDRFKMPRRIRTQQLGRCVRCGYISSQEVCKACMLLEGLNKNRPKTAIHLDLGDESGHSRRRLEHLSLDSG